MSKSKRVAANIRRLGAKTRVSPIAFGALRVTTILSFLLSAFGFSATTGAPVAAAQEIPQPSLGNRQLQAGDPAASDPTSGNTASPETSVDQSISASGGQAIYPQRPLPSQPRLPLDDSQYYNATAVRDTARIGTGGGGTVSWTSPINATGSQDGNDAELLNSSDGDKGCIVLTFGGTLHLTSGAVQAYVHQPQGITQDMGMELDVSNTVASCSQTGWVTVQGYTEEGGTQSGGPGWYGSSYTGNVRALRIEVWSNGGNILHLNRTFDIDAVRLFVDSFTPDAEPIANRMVLSPIGPNNNNVDHREDGLATYTCAQGKCGEPINTHTGGFSESWVDLNVPTLAGPLAFQRTYSSLITDTTVYTTALGPGWAHNQDVRLIFPTDPGGETGRIWFKAQSANQYRFDIQASGGITAYVPFAGLLASLSAVGSTYVLTASNQSTYTFDSDGLLTNWSDANGHGFNYAYDQGQLITVTEPISQRYLTLDYDGQGRVISVSDHTGRHVDYGYSLTTGDLLTATDVLGQNWTFAYSGTTHLLTDVLDPRGFTVVHNDYDAQGRAYRQTNGLDENVTQVTYNGDGTTDIQDGRGFTETHTYDSLNVLAGDARALGSTISKTYDVNFRPMTVIDPLGHPMTLTWSSTGAVLTQAVDAAGNVTNLSYDPLNNLTRTVDARGLTTTMAYSGTLVTAVTDTISSRTLYTYTTASDAPQPANLLKSMTDGRGNTTEYEYDGLGQRIVMTDAQSSVTKYGYDELGRMITTTTAAGTALQQIVVDQYDAAGRLTQVTRNYLAGHAPNYLDQYDLVTKYGYDQVGNQTLITDTLSRVTRTEYDKVNRPVTVTTNYESGVFDPGHPDKDIQQVMGYDANGNVVTSTEFANVPGLARTTITEYDALNRPVTVTTSYVDGVYSAAHPDEDIQRITGYDANGNVVTKTMAANVPGLSRKTVTEYDALNRPVTMTTNYVDGVFSSAHPDEDIQSVSQYDAIGNVITSTQFAGISGLERKTYTQYDSLNRPVTVTTNYVDGVFSSEHPDEDIQSIRQYDANGNVITTTQYVGISGLERKTYTQFDSLNRPVTVTTNYVTGSFDLAHPDQDIPAVTQYDALGRVVTTTEYAGISGLERKTYTQYDAAGRPVTVTANYVSGSFDPVHPDQDVQSVTQYNAAGYVLTRTAFVNVPNLARATVTQYDELGRPITVTQNFTGAGVFDPSAPDQNIQRVTLYDGAGQITSTVEYHGGPGLATVPITTTYAYDGLGRTITTTTPLTGSEVANTVLSYNGLGQVITQTDALGRKTVTQYDQLGRPLTVTANYVDGVFSGGIPDEDLQTVTTYDAAGDRLKVRDPKSVSTQFQYNLLGQMTVVTDAITGTTRYAFNAAGQVITITDALTHSTTMAYDLLGRQTRQADALSHTSVYTYDAASNRTQMTDANGATTVYTYDLNNQLINIDYPAGMADVAFTFDGAGQRTVMTDGLGTTTWTYDLLGRPLTITDPFSASVGYVYDSAGNRLTLTYPDCRVAHYTYDLASRLTQVSSLCQDSASNSYAYDAAGRLITTTLANGVISVYGYDNADRLHTLTHSQFGLTLGAYTYTVDASGNRTGAVETLQLPNTLPGQLTTTSITYTYDSLYRLTEADYSSGEVFTYTYDAVGNRLGDGGPTGTTVYAYDIANRLNTINGTITYTWDDNGNLIDNGQGVTYTYDAANRLIGVNDTTFTYSYDGLDNRLVQTAYGVPITYTNDTANGLTQVLVETGGAGATAYLYGLSRIAQQSPASTDYFLDDGLGSVRQLADASGDVTLVKNYEPFGRVLTTTGSGLTNYGFAAEYQDPTAFYYLRARYYTSRRGRFIQADSWPGDYTQPQTLDRWVYALSNPVNQTDPSGHCPLLSNGADPCVTGIWSYFGFLLSFCRWLNPTTNSNQFGVPATGTPRPNTPTPEPGTPGPTQISTQVKVTPTPTESPTPTSTVPPKTCQPQVFAAWVGTLPIEFAANDTDAGRYQIRVAGNTEYWLIGANYTARADGMSLTDCYLVDTKYVSPSSNSSPYVPGTLPSQLQAKIEATKILPQLVNYGRAIIDPNTPAVGLQIYSNDFRAVLYFSGLVAVAGVPRPRVTLRP